MLSQHPLNDSNQLCFLTMAEVYGICPTKPDAGLLSLSACLEVAEKFVVVGWVGSRVGPRQNNDSRESDNGQP